MSSHNHHRLADSIKRRERGKKFPLSPNLSGYSSLASLVSYANRVRTVVRKHPDVGR